MNVANAISKFYKSFSGTDTIAFLMFPGINPIVLGSLTTVSYSMYRSKVPVINIGRTNINGITRGPRIYAGTMVFTLINKHWVRELQDQASYLQGFQTIKVDELPLFDIMIISANEYGNACSMFIYGVDFTDESQTLSVEDLFTENVFKFVAREVSVFDEEVITKTETDKKYYVVTTGIIKNYYVDEQAKQNNANAFGKNIKPLLRALYFISNGNPIIGTDVAAVQQLLNYVLKDKPIAITYKFDQSTDAAVRDFQTTAGLIVNGVVDNSVYTKLLQYAKEGLDGEFVQVINKSGAYVYKRPDPDSIITQVLPYLSSVEIFGKDTHGLEMFYETKDGYISTHDVYHYLDNNKDSFTYELIQYGDTGSQVTILQNALSTLYKNFINYEVGNFDEQTEQYLKRFQREHDLTETGTCDYFTWNIILNETDPNYKNYITNHADVKYTIDPGVYNINNLDYLEEFNITVTNNNTQQVKYSTITIYEDKNTKTYSNTLTFDDSQTHSIKEFDDAFKDDPKYKKPTDVYYFVYPYNSIPLKWHFKVKR